MFRIRLHIDDVNVLFKIREFLKVGRVNLSGDSCLYIISDVKDIINVLLPFIDNYKLYTTKWLDYVDFKSAVLFLSKLETTPLSSAPHTIRIDK